MGYHRAGFDVVGVDHRPQPRYPFELVQADALEYAAGHGREFDAVHASPPCQGYSRMRHLPWLKGREYPLLIEPTRNLLEQTGLPWVIENVEDAAQAMRGSWAVMLCGTMFGLKVYRHRLFASNVPMFSPPHRKHVEVIGRGRMLNDRAKPSASGWVSLPSKATFHEKRRRREMAGIYTPCGKNTNQRAGIAMGIDWMSVKELAQAIPPAYTEFIGQQLLRVLEN